jgi:EpsI family protein
MNTQNTPLPASTPSAGLARTAIILLVLMVIASISAYALKPTQFLAQSQPLGKLQTLVPMQVGDWRGIEVNSLVVPDPQTLALLDSIYTDTLSRTYTNSQGRSVMLSIAYGDDQRDGMNVHYPEVCYPAQGFQAKAESQAQITTPHGNIQAQRLEMVMGSRYEPITYWTMVGEHQTGKGFAKKINEMRYSFSGVIPDGMLVRVSSISNNPEQAYSDHEAFIRDMLGALSPADRKRFAGLPG